MHEVNKSRAVEAPRADETSPDRIVYDIQLKHHRVIARLMTGSSQQVPVSGGLLDKVAAALHTVVRSDRHQDATESRSLDPKGSKGEGSSSFVFEGLRRRLTVPGAAKLPCLGV